MQTRYIDAAWDHKLINYFRNHVCFINIPFGHQFWAGSNYWAYFEVIVYCTCTDRVRLKTVSIFNAHDTCKTDVWSFSHSAYSNSEKISMETRPVRQFWIQRLWSGGGPVSLQIVHHLVMIITRKQVVYEELCWFSVSPQIAPTFLKDFDHVLSFKIAQRPLLSNNWVTTAH